MRSFLESLILGGNLFKNSLIIYCPWLAVIPLFSLFGLKEIKLLYLALVIGWVPTLILKILWVETAADLILKKLKFKHKLDSDVALKVLKSTKIILLAAFAVGLILYPLLFGTSERKPEWSEIPTIIIFTLVIIMALAGALNVVRARFYLAKVLNVADKRRPLSKEEEIEGTRPQPMTIWGFSKTYQRVLLHVRKIS